MPAETMPDAVTSDDWTDEDWAAAYGMEGAWS
jgi:hypothetical protein